MQSPLLSEISQLAFIQRAQYHVENTCGAILNNPAAGFLMKLCHFAAFVWTKYFEK